MEGLVCNLQERQFSEEVATWWPPFTFLCSQASGSLISSSFMGLFPQEEDVLHSFTQLTRIHSRRSRE